MIYPYKSKYYKVTLYCIAYGGNPWKQLTKDVGARRVKQFTIALNKQFS